jgi:hypothetical protein
MRFLDALRLRLRALMPGAALDAELREELRDHLQQLIDENIAAGMRLDDARLAALRSFGGVEQLREESRDGRGVAWASICSTTSGMACGCSAARPVVRVRRCCR